MAAGFRNSVLSSRNGRKLEFGPVLGGRSRRVVGDGCWERDSTGLGDGLREWLSGRPIDFEIKRGLGGEKMPCHGLRRRMF